MCIGWAAAIDDYYDDNGTIADMLESFQSILEPCSHQVHRNCMFVDWFSTEKTHEEKKIVSDSIKF